MATNDKTRQKLVDSMRRTKAPAATSPVETTTKKETIAPTASSQPKSATKVQKKAAPKAATKPSIDPFQSQGRIWPD